VEVHVSLVGRKDLTGEIYRQLRRAILDGRLPPGARLPPTRELARRLSVSRTPVRAAYDRLTGEGFVTARTGAGTFVSEAIAGPPGQPRPAGGALRPRPLWKAIAVPRVVEERLAEFDFRPGIPDAGLFPYQTWRRLLAQQLRPAAVAGGVYGDPAGQPDLRRAIARHVGVSRGVQTVAGQVVVTNGTQQAVDLVARVLLEPGDRVAVETPGYRPLRRLLASLGAEVVPVPVDAEGLVVEAIPPGVRLVTVTPSHQFPLGMAMSLPRRMALLAWAERHGAAIVEDDYDSEFRYGGRPIEPVQTLDQHGRVLYVGSFSKTMLATLRLGFVVVPEPLVEAVRAAKFVADWHTSLPTQAALAGFIDHGYLARHIRRMRRVYQERHQLIVGVLADRFTDRVKLIPSSTGLHVTAMVPGVTQAELTAVLERAWAAGVGVMALSRWDAGPPSQPGLVLGYGAIPTARIEEGLRRLRRCFDG
jgi:GntR family transcriptional regulator / MocR family aminotransferase